MKRGTASSDALGVSDYVGLAVFVFGLTFETVADVQKSIFNSKFSSGSNNAWIESGLWYYSRHPNYFGEITVWVGMTIICVFSVKVEGFWSVAGWWTTCWVSPAWSLVFLTFTSLMLLEKKADKKWGRRKLYKEYKASTPVLFPWYKRAYVD